MPSHITLVCAAPIFEVVRGMVHIRYENGAVHAMYPHDLMVGIERAQRAIAEWQQATLEPIPFRKRGAHLRRQSAS